MEKKNIRPTTAKIKPFRPQTGKQNKMTEKINFTESEITNKIIDESHSDENKSNLESNEKSFSDSSKSVSIISKEKINFLEALTNGTQKKTFENIIKEEADRIDMINMQKKI